RVELRKQLAQNPNPVERAAREQQLLFTRGGALDVDRRKDALFEQTPIQGHLLIAGAFELLEDHFVHAAAGVDQRGGDDREAATVLGVAGRAKEFLGLMQSVGIHATGKNLSRWRNDRIV